MSIVGEFKRKYDTENMESGNSQSLQIKIEEPCDKIKKQSIWHPPLKYEKEDEVNMLETIQCQPISSILQNNNSEVNDTHNFQYDTESVNIISKETVELDVINFPTCSTIYKIDEAFDNYESDKEDDMSLTFSLETIPVEILNPIENSDDKQDIDKEINDSSNKEESIKELEIESDTNQLINNSENDNRNYIQTRSNFLNNPEILCMLNENEDISTKNKPVGRSNTSFLETLKVDLLFLNKNENEVENNVFEENKCPTDISFCNNENEYSLQMNTSNEEEKYEILNHKNIVKNNSKCTDSFQTSGMNTIEDDITNSQLAIVEGDVTSAIYNNNFTKPKSNWIRIKQEQKQILQKLIREVDQLNNTVLQATKELKLQINKCSTQNVCKSK